MAEIESKGEILAAVNGTTGRGSASATPEGMALATLAFILMALTPILLGSFRSLKHEKKQKPNVAKGEENPQIITEKKAAMFPVIASCGLYGLYLAIPTSGNWIFSPEWINLVLMWYGIIILHPFISPLMRQYFPENPTCAPVTLWLPMDIPMREHHYTHFGVWDFPIPPMHDLLSTLCGKLDLPIPPLCDLPSTHLGFEIWDHSIPQLHDLLSTLFSIVISYWHLRKGHWLTNNLFGMITALMFVELNHLQNLRTGFILLGGLFFYDIFWVFETDVMSKVAMTLSLEVPILLVFPHDILENGVLAAKNFSMLGLGDIVLPGVFIAFLLRFDMSRGKGTCTYFKTSFFAYFIGLSIAIFASHFYNHAQPALLYLVPACLGAPLLLAWTKGEVKDLFKFQSHPSKLRVKKVKKSESKKDK